MPEGMENSEQMREADLAYVNAQAFYRNVGPSMVVAAANLAILTAFLWPVFDHTLLLPWSAGLLALFAVRAWTAQSWIRKAGGSTQLHGPVILTFLSGVGWGLPLFFLPDLASPATSYLLIFMTAGMSAGAAISFASHLRAVLAFNLPLLTITACHFLELGGVSNQILAGVIALYFGSTTMLALRNKQSIETAHRNQIRAEAQALEIRSLADDLKSALIDAEAATVAKSRFLANMSHEIRTPLNGVLGMVQLLERTELSDRQREFARTIGSSGKTLLGVIEDVLDISRIESGTVALANKPFALDDIVLSCLDTVAGPAEQKNLRLVLENSIDRQSQHQGDPQRIKQILINLLGNAVKFTTTGNITLRLTVPSEGLVRFDVEDTGPGLTEDQCTLVFERFAQVDASSQRQFGGSGLGLAISRELVSLMNGTIGVSSSPGQGSCFWFELPLDIAATENRAESEHPGTEEAAAEQAAMKVLVVDDTKTNQMVAQAMLEHAGHSVSIAENGVEALDRLETSAFDLVLMDIQMPVMTGDEAIRRIRASDTRYRDIPILAVTANATEGEEERLLGIGANAHATKPVSIEWITAQISSFRTSSTASGFDPQARAC